MAVSASRTTAPRDDRPIEERARDDRPKDDRPETIAPETTDRGMIAADAVFATTVQGSTATTGPRVSSDRMVPKPRTTA